MKNSDYWFERMRILEDALLDTGFDYVENLEKQYDAAIRSIEADIARWYQRFAKNNEISLADARKLLKTKELEEFKWTVEEYIKYGRENAFDGQWIKELENASARVHVSRLESIKLQLRQQAEVLAAKQSKAVEQSASKIYESSYYHTAYELQKGVGIGWTLHSINKDEIRKVLSKPWTVDKRTFSDRIWSNKQSLINTVNTELTQMIMRGTAPDNAIKAISERFKVSKSQAGRLVMTESAAFANEARKDCFKELDVEEYVIVETLDGKTCELCASLDGKVYPMSEYQIGVTAPPFHPWCRGTTAPYFADMEGIGERWAREANGKTYEVPKDMTYRQWRQKYVDNAEKSDKIKLSINLFDRNDPLYFDAFSIEEEPGFEDIMLHGSPSSVQKTIDGTSQNLNASEFAKYLRESTNYGGGDIRLASCETGKGNNSFAQQLSKELGIRVKAPDDDVYYLPNEGVLFVGSPYGNIGKWRIFNNGEEE